MEPITGLHKAPVEVFKTNVQQHEHAKKILTELQVNFPLCRINFDLEDCDKILRIEGHSFIVQNIIRIVLDNAYACSVLP